MLNKLTFESEGLTVDYVTFNFEQLNESRKADLINYFYKLGFNSYDTDRYTEFIHYLNKKGLKMQKFPLCIKESGGTFDRGMDKARFLDALSKVYTEDASAYTIKLSPENISTLRKFF